MIFSRINIVTIMSVAFLILLTGCPMQPGSTSGGTTTSSSGFYVINDGATAYIVRNVSKVYTGTNCTIWSDDEINLSEAEATTIANEFDNTIYGTVTGAFAAPYDVDSDGRVAIVVYHGETGSSYVAGYFNPHDFYTRSTYAESNEMDVVYLNGAPASHQPSSQAFNSTLAHEFQHLVNYSENVARNGETQMYTWMNEGMSENASALTYGYSTYETSFGRMSYYDGNSTAANGQVSLIYWNSQVINYSVVYAFFAFLKNKYSNIYTEIYSATGTSTTVLNTVLDNQHGSTLNAEFQDFVYNLYAETNFPAGFFPGGFEVNKTGSSDCSIYPYSFIYRTAGFSSFNSDLVYLDSAGAVESTTSTDARMAFWSTTSSYWTYNSLSDWGSTQEATNANASLGVEVSEAAYSLDSIPEENDVHLMRHDAVNLEELPVIVPTDSLEDPEEK